MKPKIKKPKSIKLCDVMGINQKPINNPSGNEMKKIKRQGTRYKPKAKRPKAKKNLKVLYND